MGSGLMEIKYFSTKNKDNIKLVIDIIQEVKDTKKTNNEQAIYNIKVRINDQFCPGDTLMIIRNDTICFISK